MHRCLCIFVGCCLLTPAARAQEDFRFPDNTPASYYGGLMIIRKGDTTTWSLGGGIFPRQVKQVTATPEGPVVAKFKLPSHFQAPPIIFYPTCSPAHLWIEVPDACSLLFVEGEKIPGRGKLRVLESPILRPGKTYQLTVRTASIIGENFIVEDKMIMVRAGERLSVTFDGKAAMSVPLAKIGVQPPDSVLPAPKEGQGKDVR